MPRMGLCNRVRYEHPAAGDLLHVDIKNLARIRKPGHRITGNPQDETRGAGWEFPPLRTGASYSHDSLE